MQQFRNVLVGVDVSSGEKLASADLGAPTREAVRRGIWVGKNLGASVTFLAVLDVTAHTEEMLHEGFADATRSVEDSARAVVAELASQAAAEGVTARAAVAFGEPWETITREVIRHQYDLVLVGTRERGAASRFVFGSTANKLLRYCPCPVWVTRPDPRYEDVNMLVACDLGPETSHLLRVAVGGGRLMDARVHLIHAVENRADQEIWSRSLPGEQVTNFRTKRLQAAESKLKELVSQSDHRTLPYGLQMHVVEGDPEDAILKAIPKFDIDLLVMGTQARTGLPGMFLGNTAERLLAQVPCSVLVLKPDGFVSPVTPS